MVFFELKYLSLAAAESGNMEMLWVQAKIKNLKKKKLQQKPAVCGQRIRKGAAHKDKTLRQ